MFCSFCGRQVADDVRFCTFCGKRLVQPAGSGNGDALNATGLSDDGQPASDISEEKSVEQAAGDFNEDPGESASDDIEGSAKDTKSGLSDDCDDGATTVISQGAVDDGMTSVISHESDDGLTSVLSCESPDGKTSVFAPDSADTETGVLTDQAQQAGQHGTSQQTPAQATWEKPLPVRDSLPDSAFMPTTQPLYNQGYGATEPGYAASQQQFAQPGQAYSPYQTYSPNQPPVSYQQPAPQPEKRSILPVVITAVIAVIAIVAVAVWALFFSPLSERLAAMGSDGGESAPAAQQIQTASVNFADGVFGLDA